MRGILLGLIFFSLLPLIFIKGPFVGILMWFWISLMAPQFIVYGFFSRFQYALIVGVATLLALLFSREPRLPPRDKTTTLLVLFLIWISITSWTTDAMYGGWLVPEKMLLMTLVAYALTYTRQRLQQLIVVCTLSVGYYGFRGGVFTLLHGGNYRVFGPTNSMIGDNNALGAALVMFLPLLFYLRALYRETLLKWPLSALIGSTAIAAIFTYSRGALLAIVAMSLVTVIGSRRRVLGAALLVAATAAGWHFAPPGWLARMETINTYQQDASAESRLYMWRLSWAMALKHPILGTGVGWSYAVDDVNRQLADSGLHWPFGPSTEVGNVQFSPDNPPPLVYPRVAHSIWFETLSDHGFPALVLFCAILLSVAIDARWLIRYARGHPELVWADQLGRLLQASLIGYAVAGTFASMNLYDGFYVIVIIAAAARRVVAGELPKLAATAGRDAAPAVARPRGSFAPRPIG